LPESIDEIVKPDRKQTNGMYRCDESYSNPWGVGNFLKAAEKKSSARAPWN